MVLGIGLGGYGGMVVFVGALVGIFFMVRGT